MFTPKQALAIVALLLVATFHAAAQPANAPARKSEPIYGYRMMDDQERNAYREQMRNARSAEERQAIRDAHQQAMQARAKERGINMPGPRGTGPGSGMGPGGGMGPGSGMGPGGGRGPGSGPRADCAAGQDCPGPGAGGGYGRGPGPR